MKAVLQAALDPEPTERELAAIDRSLPFEDRLVDAVRIMQRRVHNIWRLLSSIGDPGAPRTPPTDFIGLAETFRREQEQLRTDPVTSAGRRRALPLAPSSPVLFAGKPPSPREIETLLFDGIRVRGRGRRNRGIGA